MEDIRRHFSDWCWGIFLNDWSLELSASLEQVKKKLREARFFLERMIEQEKRAFGDREPFDFYLSAFLSASRSIKHRLQHEQPETFPDWYARWESKLNKEKQRLIKFLIDDRNAEVHESGSKRRVEQEGIEVKGEYSDTSGTVYAHNPFGFPTVIYKPSYKFTIDGEERRAVEACAEYLELLDSMVSEFSEAA